MSEEKFQQLYYSHEEKKDLISSNHKLLRNIVSPGFPVFFQTVQIFPNSSRFFHEPLDAKLWAASYNYLGHTGLTVCWVNKKGHAQLSECLDGNVINQEFWDLLPELI